MTLIARSGGFDIVHVPYKGGSEVLIAAVGAQVPIALGSLATAMPHIKSGKLRALGVTEAKRLSSAPSLPTIAESGLPGFEVSQWYGIFAPADIPRTITDKIGADLSSILVSPDIKDRLDGQGLEVSYSGPIGVRCVSEVRVGKMDQVDQRAWHKAAMSSETSQ